MSTPEERAYQRQQQEAKNTAAAESSKEQQRVRTLLADWRAYAATERAQDYPHATIVMCCTKQDTAGFFGKMKKHVCDFNHPKAAYIVQDTSNDRGIYYTYCIFPEEIIASSMPSNVCLATQTEKLEAFLRSNHWCLTAPPAG